MGSKEYEKKMHFIRVDDVNFQLLNIAMKSNSLHSINEAISKVLAETRHQ